MSILSGLEPERVFYYFEQICAIPHGSYHEQQISDYLMKFAGSHGLRAVQDKLGNVILFIPASAGYEDDDPLILQGHMDMVCEKREDSDLDMEREGLRLATDGAYVYAEDSTLGGDDGIAVAYMLAIAENADIPHPPLECVITVSEEVGMEGAREIDLSMLNGRRMINLDSEEEGIFLTSCAGGVSLISRIPVEREQSGERDWYRLTVSGLTGGHSGCEIHKGRANAIFLLGNVLRELFNGVDPVVCAMEGGNKDNAIPVTAWAEIGIPSGEGEQIKERLCRITGRLREQYDGTDPELEISMRETGKTEKRNGISRKAAVKLAELLHSLPNGVQAMSGNVRGLVQTSLNLGIMRLEHDHLFLQYSVRSSMAEEKGELAATVEEIVAAGGGSTIRQGDYPAWEYREESVLRTRAVSVFEELYGRKPEVTGIHAGLECGLLAGKIAELDCISMGPDILDIHTTSERMDVASVKRVYEFLLELLQAIHYESFKKKGETECG